MEPSTSLETISSDVLIIGGGFGGLWSALRAAECGSSVVLLDKSFVGKCGHSFFAGGARMVLLPDGDLDEYVHDIAVGNEWLVDQEQVAAIFAGSFARLKDMESFGFPFRKSQGDYVWTKARGTTNVKDIWPESGSAADEVTILRKVVLAKGVRVIDNVFVYDLLKDNKGNIAGAAGIAVKSEGEYVFRAKAVIIATNSGGYRGHHLASELQGTGPFMAYDAGARIENPEFHYINIRPAKHEIEGSGILPALGARWVNGKGECFMDKYDPVLKDRAPTLKIIVGAAKEVLQGNGPIAINVREMKEEERERFRLLMVSHGWMPLLFEKCKHEYGFDLLRENIDWRPAYESNKLGLQCDLEGRTTLTGLFAAGMARTLGINPFTGWSIAACTWSGYAAGESASHYARDCAYKELDPEYLNEKRRLFFQPLHASSAINPDSVVYSLQKLLFPLDVLIIMREEKLVQALNAIVQLKQEQIPALRATDVRSLIKARETQTMVLSAEMTLRASILRKETRPSIFYRDDYPLTDNANWLKWITVEKTGDGGMKFSTEAIPFEKYKFSPQMSADEQSAAATHGPA